MFKILFVSLICQNKTDGLFLKKKLYIYFYWKNYFFCRPWDSVEDLEHPVILSGSGCASGCASDMCPPVNTAPTSLLLQSPIPTLPRSSKPGSIQFFSSSTLPIRSVSGKKGFFIDLFHNYFFYI